MQSSNNLSKIKLSWDVLSPQTYRNQNSLQVNSPLVTLMEDKMEKPGMFPHCCVDAYFTQIMLKWKLLTSLWCVLFCSHYGINFTHQ